MAAKLMCSTVFLLVLIIFCYGIISTEERLLKTTDRNNNLNYQRPRPRHNLLENPEAATESVSVPPMVKYDSISTPPGTVGNVEKGDDYRPTDPGHSPGAGHGIGHSDEPATVELNQ